jgi:hypothetical protein
MTTGPLRKGKTIETRYLNAGGQLIQVELQQTARGAVSARFFLGSGDTPIIDAPTEEAALGLVQCALDVLLAKRSGDGG